MDNTNVKEEKNLISLEYQGAIYFITKEEFEDLQNGYRTFKEMFG